MKASANNERIAIYKRIVESILIYNSEVWTLNKAPEWKLIATELDAQRRRMRDNRPDKLRNKYIRHERGNSKSQITKKDRHLNRMGEDSRINQLLQWVLSGKKIKQFF